MARKHVMTVGKDKTQVITLPVGKSEWEYRVRGGIAFSLVVTSDRNRNSDARITVKLVGRGASATITGVLIGHGASNITLHTMQVHQAPETTSDLLIKTVLSDRARCLYDGGILVTKLAQQTNAYQRNENLLVSGRAYAESKPSLEILANDVRCTHGATAGPIDEEELWYLAARGIGKSAGERLITEGFISDALMRVEDKSIISKLWQTLSPQLR